MMNHRLLAVVCDLAGILFVVSVLAACALKPAAKQESRELVGFLRAQPNSDYSPNCATLSEEDRQAVEGGRYIDPNFTVLKWHGEAPAPGQMTQTQNGLLEEYKSGRLRMAIVVARGGMGKSFLARSMEARLCGYMPVFKLDAKEDILSNMDGLAEGDNAILKKIRALANISDEPEVRAEFDRLLKKSPWLLLVDSMDELGLKQRPMALRQLKEVLENYSEGLHLVVFARPPVFANAYELASVDSMLRIQDLTCDRVEERIGAIAGSFGGAPNFWDFAADLGVSRKVLEDNRCFYPQMSTYRDINVAASVALGAELQNSKLGDSTNQKATRSRLYGHYIDQVMGHVGTQTGTSKEFAADLVQKMVSAAGPNPYTRDISFDVDDCLKSLGDSFSGDAAKYCAAMFGSRLFKKAGVSGGWRFTNQSVMDFFLAQWMDAALGKDGSAHCVGVTDMWRLFESNEVAGFLVGMENGVQCLPEVFMQLCINGANFGDTLTLMDQGLPLGLKRVDLLRSVREKSKDKLADSCFRALVNGLTSAGPKSWPSIVKGL